MNEQYEYVLVDEYERGRMMFYQEPAQGALVFTTRVVKAHRFPSLDAAKRFASHYESEMSEHFFMFATFNLMPIPVARLPLWFRIVLALYRAIERIKQKLLWRAK